MEGKRTKGRKKIEMKWIENKDDCLITFSKRRSGICKKASDQLVTLCGAEVGIVIFSPAGKPFSFAHPSIASVANRLLNVGSNQMRHHGDITRHDDLVEAHRRLRINEMNQKYEELFRQLEYEKKRGKVLQMVTDARGSRRGWWEIPVELLNFQELQQMEESLGMLYTKVCTTMKIKRSHGGQVAPSSFGLMQVDQNNFSAIHPGCHDHHGNFQ